VTSPRFPLPDYEQLSARAIVSRLPSLTPDELAQVEARERAGRGRQTVLRAVERRRSRARPRISARAIKQE
jgi:hypothetical protein